MERPPVVVVCVFVGTLAACARPEAPVPPRPSAARPAPAAETATPAERAFAVVTLSRGRGVPPEARAAMQRVSAMVEADRARGIGVETRRERIGLEGETRLCVRYESAAEGARARARAEEMTRGTDLVRIEKPCE